MDIQAAQQEVRKSFACGSVGQAVSGAIWLISTVLSTWVSTRSGIIALVLCGFFIFPLTQLALRLTGYRASLPKENPFNALAMQVAFVAPLCLPVIAGAAMYNLNWFYPAWLIVVGAHYLPFITLYGMWQFGVLSAVMVAGGLLIGLYLPKSFTPGGWLGVVALLLFALVASRLPDVKK